MPRPINKFPIYVSNTDSFNGSGDTVPEDGVLWYRIDTGELKAMQNGIARTLFSPSGQPANPPPTVIKSGTLSRATTDSSSVQNVTDVGFQARMVYVIASSDQDSTTFSDGWGDGLTQSCSRSSVGIPSADLANALNVQMVVVGAAAGWTARMLGNPQGFDVDWTKVGAGLNVTVRYLAIK
jgi:hypothetical protein